VTVTSVGLLTAVVPGVFTPVPVFRAVRVVHRRRAHRDVLEERNYVRVLMLGARAFVPAVMAASLLITTAPSTPVAAAGPVRGSEAAQIIRIAKAQLGDRYRYGAMGPSAFDCSGLVLYAYKHAGDYRAVGYGRYRSARALYRHFRAIGLASRTGGQPGDIVIWGHGTHAGIYLGNGYAISALTRGVRIHRINALTAPFTAFLHTHMNR
jgi:NlpC/P60 family protein